MLLHISGVGVGLFWRGEDRHSGGILPGRAAQEAPLTVRAAGICSSVCSRELQLGHQEIPLYTESFCQRDQMCKSLIRA